MSDRIPASRAEDGSRTIPVLESIASVTAGRKVWLCDIWGVLHNGVTVFETALDACRTYRATGGQVILISNSPRPGPGVAAQMAELGIDADCYDAIVTSGDVTRALVEAHLDKTMYHLGPDRDRGFFDGIPVRFAPPAEAQVLICTGLEDDETEAPEDYRKMLQGFASRGVLMICGNPDIVVERGDKLIPCAGALAMLYEEMGQTVLQVGKPHPPIYDVALQKITGPWTRAGVLAIGDGVETDIRGAAAIGIDAIYIASRVHLPGDANSSLSPAALRHLFQDRPFAPLAAMPQLAW